MLYEIRLKHPNPLFTKWLKEWLDEAERKNLMIQDKFRKAIESLQKFPLVLKSGKECLILENFDKELCLKLDVKLQAYKQTNPLEFDHTERRPAKILLKRDGENEYRELPDMIGEFNSVGNISCKRKYSQVENGNGNWGGQTSFNRNTDVNVLKNVTDSVFKNGATSTRENNSSCEAPAGVQEPTNETYANRYSISVKNLQACHDMFEESNNDNNIMKNVTDPFLKEYYKKQTAVHTRLNNCTCDAGAIQLTSSDPPGNKTIYVVKRVKKEFDHDNAMKRVTNAFSRDDAIPTRVNYAVGAVAGGVQGTPVGPLTNDTVVVKQEVPVELSSFAGFPGKGGDSTFARKNSQVGNGTGIMAGQMSYNRNMGDSCQSGLDGQRGFFQANSQPFQQRIGRGQHPLGMRVQTVKDLLLKYKPHDRATKIFGSKITGLPKKRFINAGGNVLEEDQETSVDLPGNDTIFVKQEEIDELPSYAELAALNEVIPNPQVGGKNLFANHHSQGENRIGHWGGQTTFNRNIGKMADRVFKAPETFDYAADIKVENEEEKMTGGVQLASNIYRPSLFEITGSYVKHEPVEPSSYAEISALNEEQLKMKSKVLEKSCVPRLPVKMNLPSNFLPPPNAVVDNTLTLQFGTNAELIMLIDNKETRGLSQTEGSLMRTLINKGVKCEVRHLQVADFVWVLRNSTGDELILPFLIERKRIDDLAHSIKDGRYHEQKCRMKATKAQCIYIVEGSASNNKRISLPSATLKQAALNTLIIDGFQLKYTSGYYHTLEYLVTYDAQLRKMLPGKKFTETEGETVKIDWTRPSFNVLSFNTFMERAVKKKKFTAKEMVLLHLLQLHGISVSRAKAIVEAHPNFRSLMQFYADENNSLKNLKYGAKQGSIGPAIDNILRDLCTKAKFD